VTVFADAGIIQRLNNEFVPFAGERHEMSRRPSAIKDWFFPMASSVNARLANPVTTSQGFYIAGADGQAYGFYHNVRDPQRIQQFMNASLTKLRASPPKPVDIPQGPIAGATNVGPAPTTSVIRVFERITPLPAGAHETNTRVGRDHLWIFADEVKAMLDAAKGGQPFAMPQNVVLRIARFHLTDNIRGQPDRWRAEEVKKAAATVKPAGCSGDRERFTFSGEFALQTASNARGLEGKLDGEFELDAKAAKIVRFRAYGETQAWGDHTHARNSPAGKFPLVFAMVDANDASAKAVPPSSYYYQEPYKDPR